MSGLKKRGVGRRGEVGEGRVFEGEVGSGFQGVVKKVAEKWQRVAFWGIDGEQLRG